MRMETRTIVERIPEWFDLDEAFDYSARSDLQSCHPDVLREGWETIRKMARSPEEWWFRPSGFSSFRVVQVGMYDGWPYWRPTPAIGYVGPLGRVEVAFFYNVREHKVSRS